VVGYPGSFTEGEFRGANVHAAVKLHGIDVDDFGWATSVNEVLRQGYAQVRLSGSGRSDYREERHVC
jgi:hypothetical protein